MADEGNAITRTETFVVKAVVSDGGYTNIQGTDNVVRKLKQSRKDFPGLVAPFQPGAEVVVEYAEYQGHEFIKTAKQTGKHVPQTTVPTIAEAARQFANSQGQARGMCVKEIGDMARAGKLVSIFGPTTAGKLLAWYRTEILAITSLEGEAMPDLFKQA